MADPQPNRPLSGAELKKIILQDVENILDQDGMLAHHVAYSRVAYAVTVKVMTNNPIIPEWPNRTRSRKSTPQQIEERPEFEAVKKFPLERAETDVPFDVGMQRIREIVSPNQSRIENELPVTISFRGPDGEPQEKQVIYEKESLPDNGYPDEVADRELNAAEIGTDD
jgi:hypothetical protein